MTEKESEEQPEEEAEEQPEEEAAEEPQEETAETQEAPETGERKTWTAKCSDCGNDCEVPFEPDPTRDVYCRDCYRKRSPRRY